MNCKPAMTAAIVTFVAAWAQAAEPELKGTPSEMRQYLHTVTFAVEPVTAAH